MRTMLTLIPQCIPKKARQSHTPLDETQDKDTISWLRTLWEYLHTDCPYDLDSLEGQHILPVKQAKNNLLYVVQLTSPASIILTKSTEGSFTTGVQNVLQTLGVMLICSLPRYVVSHSQVVGTYVLQATPEAALQCIQACQGICRAHYLTQVSIKERDQFRSLIARADSPRSMSDVVCSLPIFPTIQQSELVNLNDVNVMAPNDRPKLSISKLHLSPTDSSTVTVARTLGVVQYSMSDFLTSIVLPQLKQQNYQSQNDLSQVIQFIRKRWFTLQSTYLVQILQDMPFIHSDDGHFRRPQDLADPQSAFLTRFYKGESGKFPIGEYSGNRHNLFLLDLGMKCENSVSAADLLDCARKIQSLANTDVCDIKAHAILDYFEMKPSLLSENTLVNNLQKFKWVPVLKTPPKRYPTGLKWYDGPSFGRPGEMKTADWSPEIGAVMPVCKYSVHGAVAGMFGWDEAPPLEKMIQQLKEVIIHYDARYKASFLEVVGFIYDQFLDIEVEQLESMLVWNGLEEWVWCGEGFTSPKNIVKHGTFRALQPYLYPLPPEIQKHEDLLEQCGMADSCTPDVLISVLKSVRDTHAGTNSAAAVRRDVEMVVNIVNHLAQEVKELDDDILQNILLPVHTIDGSLKLEPLAECVFCDREWLRHEGSYLGNVDDEVFNFIHVNVPMKTAEHLGVPSLMSKILDGEELEIEGWGQHEPLTTRLHGLLDKYRDGFAIPKEIVQNADDAGAKVVKFMYDERENEEYMDRLIAKGMQECQGPALWAYNDAIFTKEDFENITKLGAGTSEKMAGKIGKFGLGFNGVYNITDVPSFVSGEEMVILDPHCSYLAGAIQDNKPGIKINLSRNIKLKQRCSNQFAPYDKVFGYDVQSTGPLQGTLFRFPLRTKKQAKTSDISSLNYDREEMIKLLKMFANEGPEMLLFTQNVERIELYHLLADENDPCKAVHVMSVSKSVSNISGNLLVIADQYTKQLCQTPPKVTYLLEISVEHTPHAKNLLGIGEGTLITIWNVSWGMGQRESLDMARSNRVITQANLTSLASTAILLKPDNSLSSDRHKGKVYCFLPLPITSGLPVHINASFAVTDDRRTLCFRTGDDKENSKADWNDSLLTDAVVHVYLSLLGSMANIVKDVVLFHMWPICTDTKDNMKILEKAFYASIVEHPETPVHITKTNIITVGNMVCLHPDLAENNHIGKAVAEVMQQSYTVTPLPRTILKTFEATGFEEFILQKLFNAEKFFVDIFFPNLQMIASDTRNQLVLYALQQKCNAFNVQIQMHSCIPVKPDGKLVKPCELLDLDCDAACLYRYADEVFPVDEFADIEIRQLLIKLGMRRSISWDDMLDRAKHTPVIYQEHLNESKLDESQVHNYTVASGCQCPYLAFFIRNLEKMLDETTHQTEAELLAFQSKLLDVAFLLPLTKPKEYPAGWKGEILDHKDMIPPKDLYPSKTKYLVSASHIIVDDTDLPPEVMKFLGFEQKQATIQEVLFQLERLMHYEEEHTSSIQNSDNLFCADICSAIYGFMHKCVSQEEGDEMVSMIKERLQHTAFVFIHGEFYKPNQLAFSCSGDFQPYLFKFPSSMEKQWHHLFHTLGVKDKFEIVDYMAILNQIHQDNKGKALQPDTLEHVIKILNNLAKEVKAANLNSSHVIHEHDKVFLPDQESVLRYASMLCFHQYELDWLEEDIQDTTSLCVHGDVPSTTAQTLGVMTQRQAHYQKYGTAFEFGQHEELTNRLERIVSGYLFNQDILKELIQNADDAGASEIHFILDRQNHPSERVMDDTWKSIQGPALCVFNNKPFTQNDIQCIQKLGQGSKETDPITTGQYGIGFSTMYHLTDTPMFLTAGPDVGDTGEALCVFDPHGFLINGRKGIAFYELSDLRIKYTDFFKCFLEDRFGQKQPKKPAKLKKSTMFRFPLRLQEQNSKISDKAIHPDEVRKLLDMLAREAKDILIFLPNITQIKISEISQDGKHKVIYTCSAEVSEKDKEKQAKFYDFTKSTMSSLKVGAFNMEDIQTLTIAYSLDIKDNTSSEKWLVCQQLGFTDSSTLPEIVRKAVKDGSLALSPRGGVAYCIPDKKQAAKGYAHTNSKKKQKVFCTLPIPLETDLPVHINGHFALGYENRRTILSQKDDPGYGGDWNDILYQQVIGPCYGTLLEKNKRYIFGELQEKVPCNKADMLKSLSNYLDVFPYLSDSTPEWKTLANAVYVFIDKQQLPLLPVVRELMETQVQNEANVPGPKEMIEIQWLPTQGDGKKKLFFCNSNKKDVKDVLSQSGLLLISTQDNKDFMRKCFQEAGVPISILTPQSVVDFLKMFDTPDGICNLKAQLPAALKDTVFKNEKMLQAILDYCGQTDDFVETLQGLPLLLMCDTKQTVRCYDRNNPVFESEKYSGLVPECSDQFVCPSVYNSLVKIHTKQKQRSERNVKEDANHGTESIDMEVFTDLKECGFFKEFDIASCANMLAKSKERWVTSQEQYQLSENNISDTSICISKLWEFIYDAVIKTLNINNPNVGDASKLVKMLENKHADIVMCLTPLQQFCLLPVTIENNYFMYPMSQTDKIMTFHKLPYLTPFNYLPLPKPSLGNKDLIRNDNVCDLIRCCVTDPEQKPHILLEALCTHCRHILKPDIYKSERNTNILKFFESNLYKLNGCEYAVLWLRGLPLYRTKCDDMVSLDESIVYVLPKEIPNIDMEVWRDKEDTIFLVENKDLVNCYKFIGCKNLSAFQIYAEFILQHIEYLTRNERMKHLQYLYEHYLKRCDNPTQKKELIDIMCDIAFVEDRKGELHTANECYDPDVRVFITMRPGKVAATEFLGILNIFRECEWLDMLRIVGLITEASVDMLVEFANEIACIGINDPISVTIDTKAKIVIQYLFEKGSPESLQALRSIAFIPKSKIEYEVLHPSPNQDQVCTCIESSYPDTYSSLVWTEANIIPSNAHPRNTAEMKVETTYSSVYLHMNRKPPVKLVIRHLTNLCKQLQEKPNEAMDESSCKLREQVFKEIYIYLEKEENNSKQIETLARLPCVLVEGGQKVVCASQTVLNLDPKSEIYSFLYKLPAHFGNSHRFLQMIGTTKTVTATQFTTILHTLQQNHYKQKATLGGISSKGKLYLKGIPLNPCELFNAAKAIKGFFDVLLDSTELDGDITLDLLSETGILLPSSELVLNDRPSYYDRTGVLPGLDFLAEFTEYGIKMDPNEIIDKLPAHLQPRLLSVIVTEAIDVKCCATAQDTTVTLDLTERINSEEFHKAIVRLISHDNYLRGVRPDIDQAKALASQLSTVNVKMINGLSTHLVYNKMETKGSKRPQKCFMKVEHLGSRTSIRTMYLEETKRLGMDALVRVAEEISKVVKGRLQNSVLYLMCILQSPVDEIIAELDRHNIRQDFISLPQKPVQDSLVPIPGAEVSETFLQMLTQVQQAGELHVHCSVLVYKQHQGTQPVYVVVKKTPVGDSCTVDIGHGELAVVPWRKLYRFE